MSPSASPLGLIRAVQRCAAVPFARLDGSPGGQSAIAKKPVQGLVPVGPLGLQGDEQGNLRSHGGPEKAVHHYAHEHYATWRAEMGDLPVLQEPAAFGENISSTGLTETDICWGDRLRMGSVLLEVSQSRQPCRKLTARVGQPAMARRVQESGRTGWYSRVLEPGSLQAGDAIFLVERPWPQWPLSRVLQLLYHRMLDLQQLRELARLPLPDRWKSFVEHRLSTGTVEDWRSRIQG